VEYDAEQPHTALHNQAPAVYKAKWLQIQEVQATSDELFKWPNVWVRIKRTWANLPSGPEKGCSSYAILAAQTITLRVTNAVIATTNVGHLSHFAQAALWPDITSTQLRHGRKASYEG
jgi:hypothetical protein